MSCCCPIPDEDTESIEAVLPGEAPARYVRRVTGLKLDAALARLKQRGCRRRRCCARTPRWPWAAPSSASPGRRRCGPHAARAVGAHAPRADGGRRAAGAHPARGAEDSRVTFDRLTPAQVKAYVAGGEPRGKAGAYAIQGRAPRPGFDASPAATRASWACRCTRPRSCCARSASGSDRHHAAAGHPDQLVAAGDAGGHRRKRRRAGTARRAHPGKGLVGNVYLGKVARVLPGMQSAFIDIGLERAAFLHVADLHGSRPRTTRAAATAIRRCPSRSRCSRASR
jgi:hypothetical protein